MTTVPTTGGSIDSAKFGKTYMHEHIFMLNPELHYHWPAPRGDELNSMLSTGAGWLHCTCSGATGLLS